MNTSQKVAGYLNNVDNSVWRGNSWLHLSDAAVTQHLIDSDEGLAAVPREDVLTSVRDFRAFVDANAAP